jgi:sarcosine oxidase subunit gamma
MVEAWRAAAATVAVRETASGTMTTLRLRHPSADDLARIGQLVGTKLPTTPNRATDGSLRAIWIGPDEWLLCGETPPQASIETAARDASATLAVSVGDGRCVFEVTGVDAVDLMAKGSSIDFAHQVASSEMSVMTRFAQVNAIIDRPAGLDGYRLIFDVGVRHYLHGWFRDAVVEFG